MQIAVGVGRRGIYPVVFSSAAFKTAGVAAINRIKTSH